MSTEAPTKSSRIILACALTVMLVSAFGWWYVAGTLTSIAAAVDDQLFANEEEMGELLAALERSEGDESANTLIRDCPANERAALDALLDRLGSGLTASKLDRLELLYARCADFFAVRRHLMALRLEAAVRDHGELLAIAATLPGRDNIAPAASLSLWEEVALLEREKSERFTDLVAIQGRIIATLQAGSTPGSSALTSLLREAQEVQESIGTTTSKINALKPKLSGL